MTNKILYVKHLAPCFADIKDSISADITISPCILRFYKANGREKNT